MITREEILTPEVVAAIQQHGNEMYPRECVGYVSEGAYVRLENMAQNPQTLATFDPAEPLALRDQGKLHALVHSHPDGPNCPSAPDMLLQAAWAVPSVIVSCNKTAAMKPFAFGDQLETLPLQGRGFQHGVTDCYEYIRDWFWLERNVRLKQFPRNWEWWANGLSMYLDGFAAAGFKRIDRSEVQPGDCLLAQVHSSVPNHAAVVLGNNLMGHHATARLEYDPGKLSKVEPMARWLPYVTDWMRYDP